MVILFYLCIYMLPKFSFKVLLCFCKSTSEVLDLFFSRFDSSYFWILFIKYEFVSIAFVLTLSNFFWSGTCEVKSVVLTGFQKPHDFDNTGKLDFISMRVSWLWVNDESSLSMSELVGCCGWSLEWISISFAALSFKSLLQNF